MNAGAVPAGKSNDIFRPQLLPAVSSLTSGLKKRGLLHLLHAFNAAHLAHRGRRRGSFTKHLSVLKPVTPTRRCTFTDLHFTR